MAMVREGDHAGFDVLFDRYHGIVYRVAHALLGDSHRAKDVLQDCFLTVLRSVHTYQPRGTFQAWLLRVCRNRCLTMLDTERERNRILRESHFELLGPKSTPVPSETVRLTEDVSAAQQAIADLPPRQREALVLYAFEHLRYREIAAILGMPVNTIKTLIRRGRLAVAEAIRRETGVEP